MEVNTSGKHASLLRYGNNYCRKKIYSTGSAGSGKTQIKIEINVSQELKMVHVLDTISA